MKPITYDEIMKKLNDLADNKVNWNDIEHDDYAFVKMRDALRLVYVSRNQGYTLEKVKRYFEIMEKCPIDVSKLTDKEYEEANRLSQEIAKEVN